MDKNLLRYLNGETNVYIGELKLTRDVAPNGREHIRVCLSEDANDKEIYQHWHNPKKNKPNDTPKHTGGKQPYLMLMINEVEKLRASGVKGIEELVGYLVCLGKYIEWNTGRLVLKKEPLRYIDLLGIYGCSKPKLNKMLWLMREHDLLYHTDTGYFVTTKIVKKGKMQGKVKEDDRDVQ